MSDGTDAFESLLNIEGLYYHQGFKEGVSEGQRAGLVQGRLAGLERAFERYAALGRLHGRATTWASSIPPDEAQLELSGGGVHLEQSSDISSSRQTDGRNVTSQDHFPVNPRLKHYVRILYALTEPVSLSTKFSEDSESAYEDRLKRAKAKAKVIEKLVREISQRDDDDVGKDMLQTGESGIEDFTNWHSRLRG